MTKNFKLSALVIALSAGLTACGGGSGGGSGVVASNIQKAEVEKAKAEALEPKVAEVRKAVEEREKAQAERRQEFTGALVQEDKQAQKLFPLRVAMDKSQEAAREKYNEAYELQNKAYDAEWDASNAKWEADNAKWVAEVTGAQEDYDKAIELQKIADDLQHVANNLREQVTSLFEEANVLQQVADDASNKYHEEQSPELYALLVAMNEAQEAVNEKYNEANEVQNKANDAEWDASNAQLEADSAKWAADASGTQEDYDKALELQKIADDLQLVANDLREQVSSLYEEANALQQLAHEASNKYHEEQSKTQTSRNDWPELVDDLHDETTDLRYAKAELAQQESALKAAQAKEAAYRAAADAARNPTAANQEKARKAEDHARQMEQQATIAAQVFEKERIAFNATEDFDASLGYPLSNPGVTSKATLANLLLDSLLADGSGKVQKSKTVKLDAGDEKFDIYAFNQAFSAYGLVYNSKKGYEEFNRIVPLAAGYETIVAGNNEVKGSATYTGGAFIDEGQGVQEGRLSLRADFDKSNVSGNITWGKDQRINLHDTALYVQGGNLFFDGDATQKKTVQGELVSLSGYYGGGFAGVGAEEVVGSARLWGADSSGENYYSTIAAFGGKVEGDALPLKKTMGEFDFEAFTYPLLAHDYAATEKLLQDVYKPLGKASNDIKSSTVKHNGMSYESFVLNNPNSSYGLTFAQGALEGRHNYNAFEVLTLGMGTPTSSIHEQLSGSASYLGNALVHDSRDLHRGVMNLTADFDKKAVSGKLTWADSQINLLNTEIYTQGGGYEFDGDATLAVKGQVTQRGDYYGKFMGSGAAEVIGEADLYGINSDVKTTAAFGGTKQ